MPEETAGLYQYPPVILLCYNDRRYTQLFSGKNSWQKQMLRFRFCQRERFGRNDRIRLAHGSFVGQYFRPRFRDLGRQIRTGFADLRQ